MSEKQNNIFPPFAPSPKPLVNLILSVGTGAGAEMRALWRRRWETQEHSLGKSCRESELWGMDDKSESCCRRDQETEKMGER